MRTNLVDLLAERPIHHPTEIEQVTLTRDELRVDVRGYPWWRLPRADWTDQGSMQLVFSGLRDGHLRADEFAYRDDEALDDFSITPLAEIPWAQPSEWSVYCTAPIPAPLDVYVRVHDFLSAQGAIKSAGDFVNGAEHISRFIGITQTSGYLLARAPQCICELLCHELDRQAVAYDLIHTPIGAASGFLVRLGDSAFVCEKAEAVFADDPTPV